jgi:hypothetical protein
MCATVAIVGLLSARFMAVAEGPQAGPAEGITSSITAIPTPVNCVLGGWEPAPNLACGDAPVLIHKTVLIPAENGGEPCVDESKTVSPVCDCVTGACPPTPADIPCEQEVSIPKPVKFPATNGGAPCTGQCVYQGAACPTPTPTPTQTPTSTPTPCPQPPTCAATQNRVTTSSGGVCPSYACVCKAPPVCGSNQYLASRAASPCPIYSCQTCVNASRPSCYTKAGNYYAPRCTGYNQCGGCSSWWCYPRGKEYGNGCFPPGVKIILAHGEEVLVEEIRVGDMVLNPQTGEPLRVASVIEGAEDLPLIQIVAGERSVRVTSAHVVMTVDGLKQAKDLKLGDRVVGDDGNTYPIERLESVPPQIGQRVINFILEGYEADVNKHLLVSDGLVTGDLYLQNHFEGLARQGDDN